MEDLILSILESIKTKFMSLGHSDDKELTLLTMDFFDNNIRADSVSIMLKSYEESISLIIG
jgi:hypothetical protein